MVSAMRLVGTSQRRWRYSQAIGLPAASTMVVTPGTVPSISWAESSAATPEALLTTTPRPPTTGNSSAASTTAASQQYHTARVSTRSRLSSDMPID